MAAAGERWALRLAGRRSALARSPANHEIEMTSRPPEVSGNVTTGGSVPPVGFTVIVFSQNRELAAEANCVGIEANRLPRMEPEQAAADSARNERQHQDALHLMVFVPDPLRIT